MFHLQNIYAYNTQVQFQSPLAKEQIWTLPLCTSQKDKEWRDDSGFWGWCFPIFVLPGIRSPHISCCIPHFSELPNNSIWNTQNCFIRVTCHLENDHCSDVYLYFFFQTLVTCLTFIHWIKKKKKPKTSLF